MFDQVGLSKDFLANIKQLLNEAEHDIKNYPDQGPCYLPKAEADNIDRCVDNS